MADVDSSLYLFCGKIKEKFPVALSGECADELFCGYPWYHRKEVLFYDGFPWSTAVPCLLYTSKPQEIMPNSRKSDFIPRRRARIYDLFHLIVPKVPSD